MALPDDEIRLVVPAAPEFARLARLTVAGLAPRLGFTYDEVEDVRIAVGEACSLLIEHADRAGSIELLFKVRQTALEVTVTSSAGGDPRAAVEAGLSRQILEAVVDSFDLSDDGVHMSKRRSPAAS